MISNSEQETQKIAISLSSELKGNETICLQGNLGSGKTFFAKSLAKSLGIDPRTIKSPTFTIQREYDLADSKKIVHIDLYRLNEIDEITERILLDHIEDHNTITIIEWPERASELLPKQKIQVILEYLTPTSRRITINYDN